MVALITATSLLEQVLGNQQRSARMLDNLVAGGLPPLTLTHLFVSAEYGP